MLRRKSLLFGVLGLAFAPLAFAQVTVSVDAGADVHPIDPRIYGVAFADPASLDDLGAPLNRWGGNTSSRYNWQQNIDNRGNDWFFESLAFNNNVPGQAADNFITETRSGGAEPMLTFPMCDWIAKAGPGYTDLWSFSVTKYGAQQYTDYWRPDAGNGMVWDGQNWVPITWNDMNDANTLNSSTLQQGWFQHVVSTWGPATGNGLKYWFYDNEPSIWFATHRDVVRQGKHDDEFIATVIDYGTRARASDPTVKLFGPEEWGWSAYFFSGYDLWYGPDHNWDTPDHDLHGDFIPYYLMQLKAHEQSSGQRLLDGLTLHFYPQAGQFSDDVSNSMQLLRNRSTRSLWDPAYVDESWINDVVKLIPRMKQWVAADYPGLLTGITEYNWGAEDHMNGATTQADIFGIFGREGLDMATRWTTPDPATPTYKAMKMFRNYDGSHSGFGGTSVRATVPDPDALSAFAALRASDGALTVMVVNKALSGSTSLTLNLAGFTPGALAQRWQLAANAITHPADVPVSGGSLQATLPAPSVTLFVIPGLSVQPPVLSVSDTSVPEGDSGSSNATLQVTLSAPSAAQVSVSYATANGTATAGSDYTATTGTLSFAPGATSGAIQVPVLGDTTPEPVETFSVTLSAPVSATLGDATAIATIVDDDGGAPLFLEFSHGFRTTRDFDASATHLYRLRQAPRSSYEVVVDGLSGNVGASGPLLRRLASDLTTVLSDSLPVGAGSSRSLAFENPTGSAVQSEYVQIQSAGCSSCTPSDAYRVRAYETTMSVARFNNSGNQFSVLVLENRAGRTVTGNVHLWSQPGAFLASVPFTLAARAVFVLNTATVPAAVGQGGSVTVSHNGRYGDLAGKAVAVEPSTGFTFDTPLLPRPR